MLGQSLSINGIQIPRFLYGTAWKEERTQSLTELALHQGFRGIDTANQRRHYHEEAVGQATSASIAAGLVVRDDLFLQSKFTFRRGQDHRLPYDADAPIPVQVEQSLASSLKHLDVEWIDSFLLHGPTSSVGLTADDWAAWRAMESIYERGLARIIGVSNVTLEQLQCLCQEVRVPPQIVQNRCYANLGWDRQVRQFCAANEIGYQGFSLLTANRKLLASVELAEIATRHSRTVPQTVFRFALQIGMILLSGTSNIEHMQEDLDVFNFCLEAEEVDRIEIQASREKS